MSSVTKPQRSGDLDGEVHSRSRPCFFYTKPLHTSNNDIIKKIVRRGTLDGSLMALCGVTYTEFPDLAGLNSEITLVPIADLVPFHSRTDAGLRVKRLKEPSSSAELVLVYNVMYADLFVVLFKKLKIA